MLMISSPLSFSLSPLEGHLLTAQSLKRTKLKMKRGERNIHLCLHVKSTRLKQDFNQCKSLLFDICIIVLHFSKTEHFEALYSNGNTHTGCFLMFWFWTYDIQLSRLTQAATVAVQMSNIRAERLWAPQHKPSTPPACRPLVGHPKRQET